jgi:competence protein ComEC
MEIMWGDTCIRVLSPMTEMLEEGFSANDMSLVLLADIDGFEILFTGDIESEVETKLARLNAGQNAPIDIDVLKVAHHGSNTSSDPGFLQAFNPEYGVIQVGKNWYGHPSDQTLKILKEEDIQLFRNDQQGCIRLMLENGEPIWTPWLTMLY